MQHDAAREKLWTIPYVLILTAGTFTSLSFYMVTPMIAKYAVHIGASLAVAGVIAGLFSITALIMRPLSGVFADKFNKKSLLLISTAFIMAAVFIYSLAGSLQVLTAARILHGAAFAVSGTVGVAIVASLVPRSRLGEGIGYQGLGHIAATAFGPNLGILLGDGFGYTTVFLASAGMLAAALLIMMCLPGLPVVSGGSAAVCKTGNNDKSVNNEPDSADIADSTDSADIADSADSVDIADSADMTDSSDVTAGKTFSLNNLISFKLLPPAIIGGFFSFLNGSISSFLVLLGDERGILNIGIYFAVNAVCLLFIRPVAGRLADKKGLGFILPPCLICSALAAVLLGSAMTLVLIIAAAVLTAIGQGAGQPSIQATCIKMLPASKSGLAVSTFYIGADVGQGIGPVIGGTITGLWGYGAMYYSCAGLMLLGLLIFVIYNRYSGNFNE